MLKLKDSQTKRVIYQGLEVDVPADTNFMWLRHTKRTVLWASVKKPVWHSEHQLYIPPSDATLVAVLEHVNLTAEQVKDSLETDESLPTAQDLEKLGVVNKLVENLRSFADSLERNVAIAKQNPTSENLQALLEHVYADGGELDTLYNHAIEDATKYGIVAEYNEDSDEDHEALLKFVNAILK